MKTTKKRSALFLMGMAALALAFGLTFTGCKDDPDPSGGGPTDIDLLITALGGAATASGNTDTLTANATTVGSGEYDYCHVPDGVTLVIPGGKQLTVTGPAYHLKLEGASKLVIESTGKLVITDGYLDVAAGAGIYGGTATATDITKTKLTAAKDSGGAANDKLDIYTWGSSSLTYDVDVVPNGNTVTAGNIVLGQTLYAVPADTIASTGVSGAQAGTPARGTLQIGYSGQTITITGTL
jgi:hypothetical protein